MSNFDVKDHGERENMKTGSVRDTQAGKPRFDLIPATCLTKLALHYGAGAEKYNERNWEKGQPITRYMSSAERHFQYFKMGLTDENHLMACVWNLFCIDWTLDQIKAGKLPKELDDRTPEMLGADICTSLFNKIEENVRSKIKKNNKNITNEHKTEDVKNNNSNKDIKATLIDLFGRDDFIAAGKFGVGFICYDEDTDKISYSNKYFDFFEIHEGCKSTDAFIKEIDKIINSGNKCVFMSETVFDEIKETFNASLYGYDSERGGISKLCNINVMKPLLNLDKYNKYDFFVIGV